MKDFELQLETHLEKFFFFFQYGSDNKQYCSQGSPRCEGVFYLTFDKITGDKEREKGRVGEGKIEEEKKCEEGKRTDDDRKNKK